MLLGRVTGSIWATRKLSQLEGYKYMTVRVIDDAGQETGDMLIAVDIVGAGVDESVLIVTGSGARVAFGSENPPIDCAIVGIVDSNEITKTRM